MFASQGMPLTIARALCGKLACRCPNRRSTEPPPEQAARASPPEQPPARGRGRAAHAAPPPQQQRQPKQQPQPQQGPLDWAAIKQQAAQGYEAMLRQAGLPINAGFSRPASFTAAGMALHPAALLAGQPQGQEPAQATPPWAAAAWPSPPADALPAGAASGWPPQALPLQPWQQAGPVLYAYAQPPAPPQQQQQQAPWQVHQLQPLEPLPPPVTASTDASPSLAGLPPPAASTNWLDGSLQAPTACAMPAPATLAPQLQRPPSQAVTVAVPSSSSSSSSRSAEQAKVPRLLLKLDSDVCASGSWMIPAASCAGSRPVSATLRLSASGRASAAGSAGRRSSTSSAGRSSSSGSASDGGSASSLSSTVVEALAAAAEEGDVPRLESEAGEAEAGPPALHPVSAPAAQQRAAAALPAQSTTPAAAAATPADPQAGDPSMAAVAALARFEQLQAQLAQLQAGLPPPSAADAAAERPAGPGLSAALLVASPGAAGPAASPVQQVMQRAESFLSQAQALLQRLHLASSPVRAAQPASPAPPLQQPAQPPLPPPVLQQLEPAPPPPPQPVLQQPAQPPLSPSLQQLEPAQPPEPALPSLPLPQQVAASCQLERPQSCATQTNSWAAGGAVLQQDAARSSVQWQQACSATPAYPPACTQASMAAAAADPALLWQAAAWGAGDHAQPVGAAADPCLQWHQPALQASLAAAPAAQHGWQAQQPAPAAAWLGWEQQQGGHAHYHAPASELSSWSQGCSPPQHRQPPAARHAQQPAGYAQRRQAAAAAAAVPRPASAQSQLAQQARQGSYVQAARLAKVRGVNGQATRPVLPCCASVPGRP